MLKIEFTRDDILAISNDDKCYLCNFKYVCETICCNKKICRFHVRDNGEHADQSYYSCNECDTHTDISPNGYIKNYNKIFCEEHNSLILCDKCGCDAFYCNDHINDHMHYVTIEPKV